MSNAAAPGSIAELMNLVPDAYRPELVSDAQICAHLIELEAEHYCDDPAVYGWAQQLVERIADTHQRAAWAERVRSAGADTRRRELHAEHEGRAYLDALLSTPKRARTATAAPAPTNDRPHTTAPIWHQIPAELQARNQWVLWRLEADKNGKLTKVPYNARTARPASTTAPRTWSSFADAKAAYLARPDYFAGIGYVFSKDDPYSGADFDHCLDAGQPSSWAAAHLAALRAGGAYVEISVSGSGVHAITRATVGKGRKTLRGEVYDRGRFFTVSGRALEPTPIGDGQAGIDALRADLAGGKHTDKAARDGSAGDGDRAALAASHPDSEWDEARQLLRASRDLLIKRSQLATRKEGTQGYFAARGLWAELHQRWPHIGLYRADGALDDSQARAVLARAIYGRGFSFAEYAAIMSHHFAAYCLAKWGTKQAWREELAALWEDARANSTYAPSAPTPKAKPAVAISHKPRGRASNHADQVERVYAALQAERVGDGAIVHSADIAAACDMHRVTVAGILAELRSAGRISTERNGRYGGLIVRFSAVAIPAEQPAEYSTATAETPIAAPAPLEETSSLCVSSELREPGYSSETPAPAADRPLFGYDGPPAHMLSLAELVNEALDMYTDAPIRKRLRLVRRYVADNSPRAWPDDTLKKVYRGELARRYLASVQKPAQLRALARSAEHRLDRARQANDPAAIWWAFYAQLVRRELASRPAEPGRKPRKNCEALPDLRKNAERHQAEIEAREQAELWATAQCELSRRRPRPIASAGPAEPEAHSSPIARGLVDRLRQRLQVSA